MNTRIKIVKEYFKTNSNLQISNEECDCVDVISIEIETLVSEFNLPKDLFVFKINVSEKNFLKIQVYMKKVHNYNKRSDRILTFFNTENLVEDDKNIMVFSKKYVIDAEQLENYIIKKLIGYFELEVGPYRNLINLMKSLLPFLNSAKQY